MSLDCVQVNIEAAEEEKEAGVTCYYVELMVRGTWLYIHFGFFYMLFTTPFFMGLIMP